MVVEGTEEHATLLRINHACISSVELLQRASVLAAVMGVQEADTTKTIWGMFLSQGLRSLGWRCLASVFRDLSGIFQ